MSRVSATLAVLGLLTLGSCNFDSDQELLRRFGSMASKENLTVRQDG
jgi:hypothetical protein